MYLNYLANYETSTTVTCWDTATWDIGGVRLRRSGGSNGLQDGRAVSRLIGAVACLPTGKGVEPE